MDYIGAMRDFEHARKSPSVEVPAFEADGNLLALLPRSALSQLRSKPGKKAHRQDLTNIKVVVVGVGQNHDFAAMAAQINGAWRVHAASAVHLVNVENSGLLDATRAQLITSTLGSAFHQVSEDPAVNALITRFGRALSRAAAIAGDDLIYKALERSTDIGAVIEFLRSTTPLLSAEEELDPQLESSIASLEAEEALIYSAGGLKDAKWVGEYLSINPKSVAAKARRNELLAISRGDRNLYPAFQFRNGQVIPGIRELLEALPLTNGWSRLSFLLTGDPGLDDLSPIEAFATDREAALELARNADVQGAA